MNKESIRRITIPNVDKKPSPVRTGELVGKDQGKILLADFTPVSLTMGSSEIRAGWSEVQRISCNGSATFCC